nr:tRNA (adenosine(37)-N6)-threonylcarbamoyltransferase complex transferase subunit TsaD [Candidatus Neomarinimicrobiota bacterium]
MIILGIESSCDETAAAICKDGNILSSIVSSQQIHKDFGGVVPEVASREHERLLNFIVQNSLDDAEISLSDLNGIGVTQGPGLAGTLLTGVCFAKGLSQSLNIPVLGINHLEAHIYANFLADPTLTYPFVCLLVSGGHTQLWLVKEMADYELLGETRDDAAGEAFDKGARILGLDYPGGPAIEKMAHNGDCKAIDFPRAFYKDELLEFSFSGLKTSLLYFMEKKDESLVLADVAASYQKAILDVLVDKLVMA